jgi:uncharacterized protein YfbU (UPF0304 family)
MELSKQERLILYNQYEILKAVDGGNSEHYTEYQKILESGYKREYYRFSGHIDDELDDDVAAFVYDVLDMYRALFDSYNKLSPEQLKDIDKDRIIFEGFDGNNECEYLGYARFILKELKLYSETEKYCRDLDSHCRKVNKYLKMLERWQQIEGNKFILDQEQIKEIISG